MTGGIVTTLRPSPAPEKTPALSGALLAELEAHRTAGLQASLVTQPELALRVMLHGLATDAFYQRHGETVAAFHATPPALTAACPGIGDSPARQTMAEAEALWRAHLPQAHGALWDWLQQQDMPTLLDLLSVCVARAANAGGGIWTTPEGSQGIAAQVATAAGLDMRSCWTATKDSYLGRVPKALILEAVTEAAGAGVANRIAGSKKDIMVADAAQVLHGTGWLPMVLRVPTAIDPEASGDSGSVTMPVAAE